MKKILLTRGKQSLIDDSDFELVSKYKWYWAPKKRSKSGYAVTDLGNKNNVFGTRHISMHRLILKPDKGILVDHINGDGLDNRKSNIRFCTHTQNNANFRIGIKNKSGYKGVSFHKLTKKWRATLSFHNKQIYLGLFDDPKKAAEAYNKEAVERFGEFSRLNLIN